MKIRTDFVTNSSSSSFTLIVNIKLKHDKSIRYRALGGVGEGDEPYHELVATKSPSELGESESVDELADALIESIGQNGVLGAGPEIEGNRILTERSAIIKKIRSLSSMDEIESIEITGNLDDNHSYDYWHRSFIYDMMTGETTVKEDGDDFEDEGRGGDLQFGEAYLMHFTNEKENRKEEIAFTKIKELIQSDEKFDETFSFAGKHFVTTGIWDKEEVKEEIEKRGGIYHKSMVIRADYLVVNINGAGKVKIQRAIELLEKGSDLRIISEKQLRKALRNKNSPILTEQKHVKKKLDSDETQVIRRICNEEKQRQAKEARKQQEETLLLRENGDQQHNKPTLPSEATNVIAHQLYFNTSVRQILEREYAGDPSITSVEFPEDLTKIGQEAFADCVNLKEVTLPHSVKTVAKGAFMGCVNLKRAWLSEAVTLIQADCFRDCVNLEEVVLGDGVKEIRNGAFANCTSLKVLKIPKSCWYISPTAFNGIDKKEATLIVFKGSAGEVFAEKNGFDHIYADK